MDVYVYRLYPPDCVAWQTGRALFGACGDRRPFPVAISHSLDWKLLDNHYLGSFEVQGGRKSPQRPRFILMSGAAMYLLPDDGSAGWARASWGVNRDDGYLVQPRASTRLKAGV